MKVKQKIENVLNMLLKRRQFEKEFIQLQSGELTKRFDLSLKNLHPCLHDKTSITHFDRHYIYHPAWAAQILKNTNCKKHVDISSTLHFSSIVSAFVEVDFYDYRPPELILDSLTVGSQDLVKLSFEDSSVDSISCMHSVEHVGLGRYGDTIDYDGDLKAMKELSRVLSAGGNLLFVVPVGSRAVIEFNAHRIYFPSDVISLFESFGLKLVEFTLIPEDPRDGGLIKNPSLELVKKQKYGCGCFWFTK